MKVIARGKVFRKEKYPYYYLELEDRPIAWGLGIWAGPFLDCTLIISLEEPEEENVKSQDNPDL